MTYFYTRHSPRSLLNINWVASLPTDNGRISIRNDIFTEIHGYSSSSIQVSDKSTLAKLLYERFRVQLNPENLLNEIQ